uniref:Apoptosis and caspase activation inhibitor n=1 Tax=Aotus nancymaae TaxID=37293 RepID=A0A2K5CBT8_AOTNA
MKRERKSLVDTFLFLKNIYAVGPGSLRCRSAPACSALPVAVRCRRSSELGEAAGGAARPRRRPPQARPGAAAAVAKVAVAARWARRGRRRPSGLAGGSAALAEAGGRGARRRREPRGRGAGASAPVEDDKRSSLTGIEYQDIEKEVNNESGESQRGTDFSVLLSSAGASFSQFRFAEEKEWDSEASCPKQNSAFYVDSELLVRALQELPVSLRLNVAAELIQTTVPLELPQVKPKRTDDGKGLGMQLKWPLGPGGRELKSAAAGCPVLQPKTSPSDDSQKPTSPLQSAGDHLEEDRSVANLDTSQDLKSNKDGEVVQEEEVCTEPSVTEEKNMEPDQPRTSKNVTEEELEDWLDSMIS